MAGVEAHCPRRKDEEEEEEWWTKVTRRGGSVGVVACTMQPADDTDVTDRYCYFIARKSWPRSAHPVHRRARAWSIF